MRFKDVLTGAKQMRDHAAGKKVAGVRRVLRKVKPTRPMTKTSNIKTVSWDPAEHLNSEKEMAAYLEAALEYGEPSLVAAALGDIARARGMTQLARDTGLGRESLYKALSPNGNPEFSTILKVVQALGLKLHATPAK